MDILQYNILDGCREKDRYAKLCKWVKHQNVDIITFNELNNWDSNEFYSEMVKLGFSHTHLFEMKSSPYYLGIASKFPIELIKEMERQPFYHGLLHVKVKKINFLLVHLTPFESKNRENETREIVEYTKEIEEPIIIIGDLNTLSSLDKVHYKKVNTYDNLVQDEILARQHLVNNKINFTPMDILLEAGFKDLGYSEEFHHSMPSQIDKNKDIYLRIDYVLGNKYVLKYLPECTVMRDKELDKISDHYPVICNFKKVNS